jgi:quercetin dioxygenase-like cupin family protein
MQSHSLTQLVEEHLATARSSSAQRSAVTLYGGQEHDMRQTLITLAAGAMLHEHDSPGEATLQVLSGEVRLTAGEDSWTGGAGDLVAIPPQRHGLEALSDAALILTVATRA